ncbi:hypothetical protein HYH03_010141 [Edaphochlamys debaryana]|uniref:Uncharacterized protein n=1 Tax=Edaphochlamys debaryana TaxID=47281 RepID=A0A835XYX3_9CHLO|nr:hypothetical protein HYH03_010141 [Edaphochlamys debaryana]|eukprot:KAG2491573.1 hypothetical protein HYH03_010141 [Edaphochlamys debaryana]
MAPIQVPRLVEALPRMTALRELNLLDPATIDGGLTATEVRQVLDGLPYSVQRLTLHAKRPRGRRAPPCDVACQLSGGLLTSFTLWDCDEEDYHGPDYLDSDGEDDGYSPLTPRSVLSSLATALLPSAKLGPRLPLLSLGLWMLAGRLPSSNPAAELLARCEEVRLGGITLDLRVRRCSAGAAVAIARLLGVPTRLAFFSNTEDVSQVELRLKRPGGAPQTTSQTACLPAACLPAAASQPAAPPAASLAPQPSAPTLTDLGSQHSGPDPPQSSTPNAHCESHARFLQRVLQRAVSGPGPGGDDSRRRQRYPQLLLRGPALRPMLSEWSGWTEPELDSGPDEEHGPEPDTQGLNGRPRVEAFVAELALGVSQATGSEPCGARVWRFLPLACADALVLECSDAAALAAAAGLAGRVVGSYRCAPAASALGPDSSGRSDDNNGGGCGSGGGGSYGGSGGCGNGGSGCRDGCCNGNGDGGGEEARAAAGPSLHSRGKAVGGRAGCSPEGAEAQGVGGLIGVDCLAPPPPAGVVSDGGQTSGSGAPSGQAEISCGGGGGSGGGRGAEEVGRRLGGSPAPASPMAAPAEAPLEAAPLLLPLDKPLMEALLQAMWDGAEAGGPGTNGPPSGDTPGPHGSPTAGPGGSSGAHAGPGGGPQGGPGGPGAGDGELSRFGWLVSALEGLEEALQWQDLRWGPI